ncbi:aromatic-ring-hydroxylating dioxygenase subunit beta [Sphingobium sp. WCS2017Hpa-17]|uniref:aromatic-ring-hydroxylating dioxygenase subunit beta n=1 Tax=Sphingobium sp. WCS2017Hpa-17 TaxID=3073638 RepID=UPI00288B6B78|nr:aromatic-ring-hydroxylating dioxygenase subunit beta [Sphingobium sp. WCS2017Hpa-17]
MTMNRAGVEDFLFYEAELLDAWETEQWAALYTEDALYEVTSPACEDPAGADARNTLFLISDRIDRIRGRAIRLTKKTAHAEYPRSKTRHMITNVRVTGGEGDETTARANFAVFRTKEDTSTIYMGEAFFTLVETADGVRIRHKRCTLDLNSLYNQGRLTIIL